MKKFSIFSILLLATFFILLSCSSQKRISGGDEGNPFNSNERFSVDDSVQKEKLSKFRILFSSNVNGETEPCGCAVNPKGGIDRRLNFVRQNTKKDIPTIIVDAGNSLFPTKNLDKSLEKQIFAKAALVMEGHHLMGISAQNVGYLDLSAGVDFLKKEAAKSKIRLISTNLVDANSEQPLFESEMISSAGNLKIHVLGLSRGPEGKAKKSNDPEIKALDPYETLRGKLLEISRDEPVVILSDLGVAHDREMASRIERPLIFIGSRDLSSLEIPAHEGESIVVQGQFQGQQWGEMTVAWNPKASSWYNTTLGPTLKNRWELVESETAKLKDKPSSPDKEQELSQYEKSFSDLKKYAPSHPENMMVYDYRLVDMTVEYLKANELSPKMAQIRKMK